MWNYEIIIIWTCNFTSLGTLNFPLLWLKFVHWTVFGFHFQQRYHLPINIKFVSHPHCTVWDLYFTIIIWLPLSITKVTVQQTSAITTSQYISLCHLFWEPFVLNQLYLQHLWLLSNIVHFCYDNSAAHLDCGWFFACMYVLSAMLIKIH